MQTSAEITNNLIECDRHEQIATNGLQHLRLPQIVCLVFFWHSRIEQSKECYFLGCVFNFTIAEKPECKLKRKANRLYFTFFKVVEICLLLNERASIMQRTNLNLYRNTTTKEFELEANIQLNNSKYLNNSRFESALV